MANGKIRDPCLKLRERDLNVLTKSYLEALYEENRARDFILRKSEPVSKTDVRSETRATRNSKINKHKIDKSRVPKCYAMTTNLAPTYLKDCYRTFLIK